MQHLFWGLENQFTFYSIDIILTHQQQTAFENIVGKEEIAHDEQFLLFPMFSTQSENCIPICQYYDIIPLFAAELEEPKTGMWGKGLMGECNTSSECVGT